MALYRDVLRVPEYFLFDPLEDYLRPSIQGFRLATAVRADRAGRGPPAERVLGLHLEREGPSSGSSTPRPASACATPVERAARPRPIGEAEAEADGGSAARWRNCGRLAGDGRLRSSRTQPPTRRAAARSGGAGIGLRRWATTVSGSIPSASAWKVVTIRWRRTGGATWRMSATVACEAALEHGAGLGRQDQGLAGTRARRPRRRTS